MMKIKLLLGGFLLMLSSICYGQVIINQNFNAATSLPTGWTSTGSATSTQACNGNSIRQNVYDSSPTMTLSSPNQVGASNGNDIAVSVDYKVVNWSAATVATPATFGSIVLQYSTNNGASWTTIATRNAGNHVVANTCATITATVPAAAVPTGSDFRVRTLTTWEDGDYYMYNDNFIATQGGACILPTAFTSSNITVTTANFAWTDSASEIAGYNWEVVPAGNAQGAGVVASGTTVANAVATMATGLSSSTAYSFRIQSNCGGGNLSTWSTAVNFTTACGPVAPNAGAQTFNTFPPNCWSRAKGQLAAPTTFSNTTSSSWVADGFAQVGSSGAAKINIYSTNRSEWLITPTYTLTGNEELVFDVALNAFNSTSAAETDGVDDVFNVLISTDDGVSWSSANSLRKWDNAGSSSVYNSISRTGQVVILDLSAYTGNVKIGFYAESTVSNADNDLTIDNVLVRTIPNCSQPTALTAGNFTTTSANLSWTSGGSGETAWQIEYGATGFAQGTGIVQAATSNPYDLTGLTGGTTYQYYVRANCTGGDNSPWSGPFSFMVPALGDSCNTPIVLPLAADCSVATPYDLNYNNALDLGTTFATCDTLGVNDGAWFEFTANSRESISINVSIATEYALYAGCSTELLCGAIDPGGFLISGLVDGTTYKLALWKNGAQTTTNQICIQEGPTCIEPFSVTASAPTSDGVTLGWNANNAETSWEIEVVQGTAAPTGVPNYTATTNPYTLTGLSTNTSYRAFVRAVCSPTDRSEWSLPVSFTTEVGPHSFPLLEDFESDFSFFANGSGNDTNFAISTAYFHTGTKSVANAHTSSNTNNLVETGIMDLTSTVNPQLSFWQIAKTEGTYDFCFVQVSTDGGATYVNLPASAYLGTAAEYATRGYFHEDSYAIWGTTDTAPNNATWWQQETFSLAAYKVPNVRFRFRLTSDSSANREGWFLDDIEVKEGLVNYVWNGTAWNTAPEGVITSNDNMTIQAGTLASLTSAVMVGNLTLETGAALEADNGNIMVAKNLVNNGAISGAGQVVLNSPTAAVSGTGSITNLTVGTAGAAIVNGAQRINAQLDVLSGGSLNANGNITLSSNATGTARVDATDAGAITGNVNVERYIPAGNRAFRFIGSTVTGPSVFNSWQEAGVNTSGFGVQVTGTVGTVGTANATTGHDETSSGANSLFKWDAASQTWVAVTNTKTEILTAGQYYRLFVRGDRTTDLTTNAAATTATTLRAQGTLMTGSMTVTPGGTSGQFFALANPYQSKVDMSMATTTGTTAFMYYWDPNLGANGSYSAINVATGVGTAGVATNVLDAGQAIFFEDASAASTVTISESSKVSGNANGGVFSTPGAQQALKLKLYQTSRLNNGLSECDGLYLDFDAAYNLGIDVNDATKLYGANANIAIVKSTGQLLSVESRTLPTVNESIVLSTTNYLTNAYTYVATLDVLPGIVVFLKDNFTGTMTPLAQGTSTAVDFTVDMNNAASIDGSRFELVFNTTTLSNNDVAFEANLSVYPNPVKGDAITVNFGDSTISNASVLIYNTLGQQVLSGTYNNVSGGMIQVGNVSGLTNGVYLMNISSNGSTITRRFIKE